ncbi:MAG: DUF805 domain-containing protein [Pseudomonadota bacterium]|nr:DUF805 domain-containing protein [Pseudomonadota bacterium]
MFKALFADVTHGRLMRLPYLGYSLLLGLLMLGFGLGIVLAIGAGEHILGGDLQQAQDKLREWFTLPFMVVFALVSALFVFAGLNIMAKRIRDTGLPGWWTVLGIAVLTGVVSYAVSEQACSGLHTLIWFLLLLIPAGAFNKGASES